MEAIPMIIECDACKARFRLDRKLLQGHLGVRIRCRRCGGPIIVTVLELPIARDSSLHRYRHNPLGSPIPPSAPPAPPRADRRGAIRMSPSAASAQPLFEEEPVADAKPDNLVNLRSFREADRRRVQASADDISQDISGQITYPGLPFPAAVPEVQATGAPAPPAPEKLPSTGGLRILDVPLAWAAEGPCPLPKGFEEPLSPAIASLKREPQRHSPPGFFGTRIAILLAALGMALGVLFLYLLVLNIFPWNQR